MTRRGWYLVIGLFLILLAVCWFLTPLPRYVLTFAGVPQTYGFNEAASPTLYDLVTLGLNALNAIFAALGALFAALSIRKK